jgi:hypothetical protein
MAGLAIEQLILYIILGTLAAIVYSLRVLVLLERRMTKMDENIQKITKRVLAEELKIERATARVARATKRKKK